MRGFFDQGSVERRLALQAVEKACWLVVALLWHNRIHMENLNPADLKKARKFAKDDITAANRLQACYLRVSLSKDILDVGVADELCSGGHR